MEPTNEKEPLFQSVNSNSSYNTGHSSNYRSIEDVSTSEVYVCTKPRSRIWPGVIILILVLLERIGYYSLTSNLYLFLNASRFHWMYYNALSAQLIFTGVSYLACLFGGWVSDAYFGRFKTIGSAFILFTGSYWFLSSLTFVPNFCPQPLINLTCSSCSDAEYPLFSENCSLTVMSILTFLAIGTGVVKANITPFGAEQVRHTGPDGLRTYLNWLYWCVNIGALIAILGITYIQQEDGFFWGYISPAILLSCATLIFLSTYSAYSHQKPSGSPISRIFDVVKEAWKSRRRFSAETPTLRIVNQPDYLDMAKVRYGGKFHEAVVEDVKSLSSILKVFLIIIPYWMIYFQMQSTFLAQGLQMRLSVYSNSSASGDENKFTIPAAWLMMFNVIFLILFIPLLNHLIYPCLTRRGIQINMLSRMAIGMLCAASSMIFAGCLEMCRLHFIDENKVVNQTIQHTTYVAADLSILWQIPQYSLIGISEVFTSVSGMEFACSQAPSRMQGAVMGLFYFCEGIGSLLGVASLRVYEVLSNTFIYNASSDINKGNMHYFFFFLASFQILTVLVFACITKSMAIRKMPSPNRSPTLIRRRSRS